MDLTHTLILGSYVWTTVLGGFFGKVLLDLYRLVTNHTEHEIEALKDRVRALEERER